MIWVGFAIIFAGLLFMTQVFKVGSDTKFAALGLVAVAIILGGVVVVVLG